MGNEENAQMMQSRRFISDAILSELQVALKLIVSLNGLYSGEQMLESVII